MAVISLNSAVVSRSIRIAGNSFNKNIIKFIKKEEKLLISDQLAEEIKITIGNVYSRHKEKQMEITGVDLLTSKPRRIVISSRDICEALTPVIDEIIDEFQDLIEDTPPELISDISEKGIYLTGGGALISGIDKVFKEKTGLNTKIAEDALSCVAIGTGKALKLLDIEERK